MARKIPSELVDEVSLYVAEKKVYPREQDGFTQRLRKVGFSVDEVSARAKRTGGGARHTIWLAAKPGGSSASRLTVLVMRLVLKGLRMGLG